MFSMVKSKLSDETVTIWMNHLLVIYAFFLPISGRANATLFILILLLFIYRGNYYNYLKIPLKNPIVFILAYNNTPTFQKELIPQRKQKYYLIVMNLFFLKGKAFNNLYLLLLK